MKRFMVFGGDNYYPQGGANDYLISYDTLDEAMAYARGSVAKSTWCNVFDTGTMQLTDLWYGNNKIQIEVDNKEDTCHNDL